MRVPTLTPEIPLSELRREVRYTLAVLRQRPWAGPSVPVFESLLKEVSAAQVALETLEDKLEDAAAGVDEADLHLDALVQATAVEARQALNKDTTAPLWRSLFGTSRPSELIRPKLGEELAQVRSWPPLLRAAPTPALRDRAAVCEGLIKAADAALKAQDNARTAVQVFRTSTVVALVAKLNSERSGLAGEADRQSFDGQIRREAAAGIFRPTTRVRPPRPQTLEQVQDDIRSSEEHLAELRQRLTTLQAERLAQTQAAEQRRADEQTLTALRAAQAEAAKKIAEMEKRLRS